MQDEATLFEMVCGGGNFENISRCFISLFSGLKLYDFWLSVFLKNRVYGGSVRTLPELKASIAQNVAAVSQEYLRKFVEKVKRVLNMWLMQIESTLDKCCNSIKFYVPNCTLYSLWAAFIPGCQNLNYYLLSWERALHIFKSGNLNYTLHLHCGTTGNPSTIIFLLQIIFCTREEGRSRVICNTAKDLIRWLLQ